MPVPGPEFVEGENVGGTSFDPCFLADLGGGCFGAADHPGMVALDECGGAFAEAGFTGSFADGILLGILLKPLQSGNGALTYPP